MKKSTKLFHVEYDTETPLGIPPPCLLPTHSLKAPMLAKLEALEDARVSPTSWQMDGKQWKQ